MYKRFIIVFFLGFSSGLPLPLVSSTLQAWFSDAGMSLISIGMLSLIGLPYTYRMFWGPLLDRYGLTRLGKRRSWILLTQLFLLAGFNLMAWFSPQSSAQSMALLAFCLASISATQDMAIEAHRTEYLPTQEQGLGASVAVLGYRIALLLSGGLALIIAYHYGWAVAYKIMGFLLIFGILADLYSPEPSLQNLKPISFLDSFKKPLQELAARKSIISLILFILFYKAGEAFTASTSGIVMPFLIQGLGFSLDVIGYVNKIIAVVAIVVGGLISGILLFRWTLGRSLMVFGFIQAAANLLFVLLALSGKDLNLLIVAVILDNFAAGMGSTALVALFMRLVDKRYTATQFSIFAAIAALPRVFSGPFAALLQPYIGWAGIYVFSVIIALAFVPFLIIIRSDIEKDHSTSLKEEGLLP